MFDLYSETELDKIRSLGKFYETIPDYHDIHHLSKNEFNNTLERLKETSNKLKNKPISTDITNREKKKNQIHSSKETIGNVCSERNSFNISFTPVPKVLKTRNENSRRKTSNHSKIKKSYSLSQLYDDIQQLNLSNESNSPKSSNSKDLQNNVILHEKPSKINKIKKNISLIEDNKISDKNILSKYCTNSNLKKKRNKPQISNSNKFLFLGLNIQKRPGKGDTIVKAISNSTAPSPMYPAARLNLAATLRAEISHKKRYELNNTTTTYRPKKSQCKFDWEVRKSPGWKSLTYCESNKDDLLYRLETRKAEQNLQKQEYKNNMELMRQRVKSAPLLLEGMTYWNSRLHNKLAYTCGSGKQSRLSVRCKYLKNNKNNDAKYIEKNDQIVDSDDLSSEDRALL